MPPRKSTSFFDQPKANGRGRACDHPGCEGHGEYRAPKSRERLSDYFWFCLDHVRDYNQAWNYYKNMPMEEVESHVRFDSVWQRPSWPLGARKAANKFNFSFTPESFFDPFELFAAERDAHYQHKKAAQSRIQSEEEKALSTLGFHGPADWSHIRARFKELVKRYHPDVNQGDPLAEERFKEINEAYQLLRRVTALATGGAVS
ncbi:MAG: J domain-containing protein [Dongiaceae bacterium]